MKDSQGYINMYYMIQYERSAQGTDVYELQTERSPWN
jgi:hypothetical protein